MWYIDDVGFVRDGSYKPGEYVRVPYLYHDSHMRETFLLDLHLTEYETGNGMRLQCRRWTDFWKEITALNPYGLCRGGYAEGDAMYAKIDKLSIDFLGYVDSVYVVSKADDALLDRTKNLQSAYSFWDDMRSIVDCSSSFNSVAFTLFQIMCFLKDGWVGDKFYLKGRTGILQCVEFCDVKRARTMISKATAIGYNPVLAQKANVPHLFRKW